MEDSIFKRFIYNSIGFASLATKRMEELINDLLSQGKVSEEEGKKIMDNFKTSTNRTREDLEKDMKSLMEQMMRKMDVAHKRDLEALEARVTALENIHLKDKHSGRPGPAEPGPMDRPGGNIPPSSKPHGDTERPQTDPFKERNDLNNPDNPTTI